MEHICSDAVFDRERDLRTAEFTLFGESIVGTVLAETAVIGPCGQSGASRRPVRAVHESYASRAL